MDATNRNLKLIEKLKGKLIVSCQDYVEAMVDAAIRGNASGLRINSPAHVRFARKKTEIPIIACNKMYFPNSPIYITPSVRAAIKVVEAGADIVAFDCTDRRRVRQKPKEIVEAIHSKGALALADLSCIDQAQFAVDAGADILATTLAPDYNIEFVKVLVQFGKPVLAEGHISSPEQAKAAIKAGAWSVCIGSAITRPHLLTKSFSATLGE